MDIDPDDRKAMDLTPLRVDAERAERIEITVVVDVFDERRLRSVAASRMARSEGGDAARADLGRLVYEALVGSNPDPVSPADMGVEIVDVRHPAGTTPVDLWDSSHTETSRLWYRMLPETTVEDLFAEARDMVYIREDEDGFWLDEDGVAGQGRHDTLTSAKRAGDELCDRMESEQAAALLKDAGLDPSDWTFEMQGGARFRRRDGAFVEADVDDLGDRQRWHSFEPGVDDPVLSDADDVRAAVAALPPL